jgi:uncharacterized protein
MVELDDDNQVCPVKPQPLTDLELERLAAVLKRFGDTSAMNLEQLDGFLAALICCPDLVPPSEYLPKICGGNIVLEDEFSAQPILKDFLSLIMRHWNAIVDTLQSGEVYLTRTASRMATIGQTVFCEEWNYARSIGLT